MCLPYRIASIDFTPPLVVSGSSDKHLRLFDVTNSNGWCTSPDFDNNPTPFLNSISMPGGAGANGGPTVICHACGHMTSSVGPGGIGHAGGSGPLAGADRTRCVHADLVRTVALGDEFVLSGSYDLSIKVRTYFNPFSFSPLLHTQYCGANSLV